MTEMPPPKPHLRSNIRMTTGGLLLLGKHKLRLIMCTDKDGSQYIHLERMRGRPGKKRGKP
jgi:hypothetical protein